MAATSPTPTLTAILPQFLSRQRWFASKARSVTGTEVVDWSPVPGDACTMALVRVHFASGEPDLYFAPLSPGDVPRDALADSPVCEFLLDVIGTGREIALGRGRVCGVPTAAFAELRGTESLTPQPMPATSSNTLVAYGDRLLAKFFRRLKPGINPDFEVGRFLTERASFRHVPRLAGALEYRPNDGTAPFTLAVVHERVPNDGDGWAHALAALGRYYADSTGTDEYHVAAAILGQRTAELHAALASDPNDPAFAPEQLTADDMADLSDDIAAQAEEALAALADNVERLPPDASRLARTLLEIGPKLVRGTPQQRTTPNAVKTRVHGDYHLGQTLWRNGDYAVIDFEGEPTRPMSRRRAKFSPARDVAGMLRSYHYAAYAALSAAAGDDPRAAERLRPRADRWYYEAQAVFLREYEKVAVPARLAPPEEGALHQLVAGFMMAKALYELTYELNNRPDWVRIPLRGVLTLLGRLEG